MYCKISIMFHMSRHELTPGVKSDSRRLLNVFASLAVIGGHTNLFRVGGGVESMIRSGQNEAMRERGLLVSIDRASGKYVMRLL